MEAIKAEGNNFFKAGNYASAIEKYQACLKIDDTAHAIYSNMSAAHAGLKQWDEAAEAGRGCIRANKTFIKGYFRLATALKESNKYAEAMDTLKMGLGVEPKNKDLKEMLSKVEELSRQERVVGIIARAGDQHKAGDFAECMKTIDRGLALDAGNKELVALQKQVQPKFDKAEKMRVSGMTKNERSKEAGDKAFKNAQFEEAINEYTKAIEATADKTCLLALKTYSNRAACYKQLSNFDGTIEDCSSVIDADPENTHGLYVKSLVRRAQAFEAVERYKSALQDVKECLLKGQAVCGNDTWKLCNDMQNRLNRVIAQLKKM